MIEFFRRLLGRPKVPEAVPEMFAHQAKAPREHCAFGLVEPYGISGWKTDREYQFLIDGVDYRVSVRFLLSEIDDGILEDGFRRLSASVAQIFEALIGFVDWDDYGKPESPGDVSGSLELPVRSRDYSDGFQWVGTGVPSDGIGMFHLFFEGLDLRGAVPDWDDPASGGFEDWEW